MGTNILGNTENESYLDPGASCLVIFNIPIPETLFVDQRVWLAVAICRMTAFALFAIPAENA